MKKKKKKQDTNDPRTSERLLLTDGQHSITYQGTQEGQVYLLRGRSNTKEREIQAKVCVRASRTDTYLATRSIISFLHSFVDSSCCSCSCASPLAPPLPLSPFLASSAAWRGRLCFCASSLCHLVMKQSAASTTPRYHFSRSS